MSKRTRAIVAGAGGRGRWAARSVLNNESYELVALLERDPDRLEHRKKELGLPDLPGYTAIEQCIEAETFDAALVAVGDSHHAEVTVPLLEAGKYVFVEKPLETTAEKCRAIVAADERAGGKTFVGFNLRFAPVYMKIRELIEAGALGRILTIQADEFYNGGRTYFRRWNRLREHSGGLWITKACHDFDILWWMAGKPPVAVSAVAGLDYYVPRDDAPLHCNECDRKDSCPDSHYVILAAKSKRQGKALPEQPPLTGQPLCLYNSDKDTFDHGIATVEFENGVFATYTCNVVTGFSDRRIRVSGTKATVDGSLHEQRLILHKRDPSATEEITLASGEGGHGGGDKTILESFHEFAQGRAEPKVRPAQAIVPVLMGLAATRASDEKRRVALAELGL